MTKPITTYTDEQGDDRMMLVDIDATRIVEAPRGHAVEMPADYDPSEIYDVDVRRDFALRVIDDEEMRERGWTYDVESGEDGVERVWRRIERVLEVRWDDQGTPAGWCYELTEDGEVEDADIIEDLVDAQRVNQMITDWTTVRCWRQGDAGEPEGDLGPMLEHFGTAK